MRITQWGEYGVHCTVFIAKRQRERQGNVNAPDIAAAQGIDLLYAQQILQRLRKRGIIRSIRGPQGGYKLCQSEDEVTLFHILSAAEGSTFAVMCDAKPLSPSRCAEDSPCGLRTIWHELRDHVNGFLSGYTLRDLVERSYRNDALTQIGTKRKRQRT